MGRRAEIHLRRVLPAEQTAVRGLLHPEQFVEGLAGVLQFTSNKNRLIWGQLQAVEPIENGPERGPRMLQHEVQIFREIEALLLGRRPEVPAHFHGLARLDAPLSLLLGQCVRLLHRQQRGAPGAAPEVHYGVIHAALRDGLGLKRRLDVGLLQQLEQGRGHPRRVLRPRHLHEVLHGDTLALTALGHHYEVSSGVGRGRGLDRHDRKRELA
mmetsp:Transcript_102866/g.314707  ORF Transcript_102866/g.314707 Transcript_102866/m.314707 type:complete len:212 (-) Transcript_102866:417-1052(-)